MTPEGPKFVIQGLGGKRLLSGKLAVNGSKNDALQALSAVPLFAGIYKLKNVPEIEDINKLTEILVSLGIKLVSRKSHELIFDSSKLSNSSIDPEISKRLRGSVILTGPLIARTGSAYFPHPGGCVIGERPIDFFLDGFKTLGTKVTLEDKMYKIEAPKGGLKGAEIFFRYQSVTATETFMMAATLARGVTILKNCAIEPEIENLGNFLNKSGAKIEGLGTTTLKIRGGKLLHAPNVDYKILPDRIEAGSLIVLGALAAKKLEITNCEPKHLESLITWLRLSGVKITIKSNSVIVIENRSDPVFAPLKIRTHEYPGFPTDLQAIISVFLTQATGESKIFETIFEDRLHHLHILKEMGGNITVHDAHRATIIGPTPLQGRHVYSPDLRAGLAYVIAATIASGESVVHNVHYIDRGYERLEERLRQIGLNIKKE